MGNLLAFVAFCLFCTFLIYVGVSLVVRMGSWSGAYLQIAKRFGAQISYPWGRPRLSFQYCGSPCQLRNSGGRLRGPAATVLTVHWPIRHLRLYISSAGPPQGFWMASGLQPVELELNQNSTSRDFQVYSNQPQIARQVLTPTSQWQIQQLIQHDHRSGIEISIYRKKLKISKPGFIKRHELLDDFVQFSLDLFDQFKLALNQDVEFISENSVLVLNEAICPICSQQVDEQMVTCVRCKTPHCADCWEYNGQCATFACRETRFFRVRGSELHSS